MCGDVDSLAGARASETRMLAKMRLPASEFEMNDLGADGIEFVRNAKSGATLRRHALKSSKRMTRVGADPPSHGVGSAARSAQPGRN